MGEKKNLLKAKEKKVRLNFYDYTKFSIQMNISCNHGGWVIQAYQLGFLNFRNYNFGFFF